MNYNIECSNIQFIYKFAVADSRWRVVLRFMNPLAWAFIYPNFQLERLCSHNLEGFIHDNLDGRQVLINLIYLNVSKVKEKN